MTSNIKIKSDDATISTAINPLHAPKKQDGKIVGKWQSMPFTFETLEGFFSKEKITSNKKNAGGFSFARYKNGCRNKANVLSYSGVVYDFDDGKQTVNQINDIMASYDVAYFIKETYNSTPECTKFHLIIPFTHAVVAGARQDQFDRHYSIALQYNLPLNYDTTCKQPERYYNTLSRPADAPKRVFISEDGTFLDPSTIELVHDPRPAAKKKARAAAAKAAGKELDTSGNEMLTVTDTSGKEIDFRKWFSANPELPLATIVHDLAPDHILSKRDAGGYIIQCPHKEGHSDPDKRDTATVVDNPSNDLPAMASCLHGSCEDRDSVEMLHGMILDNWFTFEQLHGYTVAGFIKGKGQDQNPIAYKETILPPGFQSIGDRITTVPNQSDARPIVVCERISFTGMAEKTGGGGSTLICEVVSGQGHTSIVYVAKGDLHTPQAIQSLRDAGGRILDEARMRKILAFVEPSQHKKLVTKGGWHDGEYVLTGPEAAIFTSEGVKDDGNMIYTGKPMNKQTTSGTVAQWSGSIGEMVKGNTQMQFGLCAGLSAPLLSLLNIGGGGFHFHGKSSQGKTIILWLAGSLWGGKENFTSYRATDNAMESVCDAYNDGCLCIDEIGQLPSSIAFELIYMMANGMGKARADSSGNARDVAEWVNCILSTGEITIGDKIAENRFAPTMKGGQAVRMVDIEIATHTTQGMVLELNGFDSSKQFVDAVKTDCNRYYGTAARAFLEHLLKPEVQERLEGMRASFVDAVLDGDVDGQVFRIADRFAAAAVAGELAIEAGIFPWKKGDAIAVCTQELEQVLAIRGTGSFELSAGLRAVDNFLYTHAARFHDGTEREVVIRDRVGDYSYNKKSRQMEYRIPAANWHEVCGGYVPSEVAKTLCDQGRMMPSIEDGKFRKASKMTRLVGFKNAVNCYVIIGEELSQADFDRRKAEKDAAILEDAVSKLPQATYKAGTGHPR